MLAAHRDQENLIHEQQTAAAAKPLNQSVRGLAPKTPGNNANKTFNAKVPLRSGGRGDENTVFGGAKTTKSTKNAFVTPVAPRERAPLGAKTTNAKATAFQTPGPMTGGQGLQKTQRPSASARKHKLKIHQAEAVDAEPTTQDDEDDEVPDIEYCPPKITELPDTPDDPYAFGPDKTFPQFEGENALRGYYSLYLNPIGEDGLSKKEREAKEQTEQAHAWSERILMESLEREFQDEPAISETKNQNINRNNPAPKPIHIHLPAKSQLSTLNAKSAAAALSNKPSYAAPTAAANARKTTALPTGPASKRNVVASRSTIGYAKGRKVSSSMKEQEQPQASNSQKSTYGDRLIARMDKEGELMQQLMRRPSEEEDGDSDDDELIFRSGLGSRNVFEEEAIRPFVLRLPDYGE